MPEPATLAWLERHLAPGEHVTDTRPLRGGWTSRICAIRTTAGRELVLRSFLTPFFRRHAGLAPGVDVDRVALCRGPDEVAASYP